MLKPRSLLLIFFLLLSFTWLFSSGIWKRAETGRAANKPETQQLADPSLKKMKLKAADAKLFVQQKGYNEAICFLVDMNLPSGQNRFFIYDFRRDTLQNSGLLHMAVAINIGSKAVDMAIQLVVAVHHWENIK